MMMADVVVVVAKMMIKNVTRLSAFFVDVHHDDCQWISMLSPSGRWSGVVTCGLILM